MNVFAMSMRRANQTSPSPLGVVDEARERVGAGGVAGDPRVQPDRHHPRHVVAVVAQAVEVRLRHLEEVLGAAEAAAGRRSARR